MPVITEYINIPTKGRRDMIDLTGKVREIISARKVMDGIVVVFVPGSTAGVTTIEFEPGLQKDMDGFLERLLPYRDRYAHHETWHDDNGAAHLQASLIGPSLSIPLVSGNLTLGTWQQIVLIDCDTRPRSRDLVIQIFY